MDAAPPARPPLTEDHTPSPLEAPFTPACLWASAGTILDWDVPQCPLCRAGICQGYVPGKAARPPPSADSTAVKGSRSLHLPLSLLLPRRLLYDSACPFKSGS